MYLLTYLLNPAGCGARAGAGERQRAAAMQEQWGALPGDGGCDGGEAVERRTELLEQRRAVGLRRSAEKRPVDRPPVRRGRDQLQRWRLRRTQLLTDGNGWRRRLQLEPFWFHAICHHHLHHRRSVSNLLIYFVINSSINWLIDWLIDWLTG